MKQSDILNGSVELNGKIKTKYLSAGRVTEKLDERKRKKRAEFPSVNQPKITVKTINGVDWDSFVKSIYRVGVDTVINGSKDKNKNKRKFY